MSWGSWMLIIFFPLATLQAVIVNERWVGGINLLRNLISSQPHLNLIAMINVHMGAGMGFTPESFFRPLCKADLVQFHPGLCLSDVGAFIAAALVMLMAPRREKLMFSKMDMYFISLEGFATTLFIIGGITGSENIRDAMFYLISGPYAPWFWVVFVGRNDRAADAGNPGSNRPDPLYRAGPTFGTDRKPDPAFYHRLCRTGFPDFRLMQTHDSRKILRNRKIHRFSNDAHGST